MSAVFESAIRIALEHEVDPKRGPWCDLPGDRGRETTYGISLGVVVPNLGITPADLGVASFDAPGCLKPVTRELAVEAWRARLWDAFGFAQLDDANTAAKLFDMSVNLGAWRGRMAIRLAQQALLLTVDGIMGPRTAGAINDAGPHFEATLAEISEIHYRGIAQSDPTQVQFLNRMWLPRARCTSSARCSLHRHP